MSALDTAHGGNILATAQRLGCRVADLIDMSSNLTPLGMVPGLEEALTSRLKEISFLPETASETLVSLFAEKHGLAPTQVLAGNGTTEFIYGVPATLGRKRSIIIEPTYSDYQRASQWAGLEVRSFSLLHEEGFKLNLDRLAQELSGGELVFICNPNNPTGGLIPSSALYHLAQNYPDTVFLVDESYHSFLPERSLVDFSMLENLFVLGSFSKVYGIPGLRLGFLAASQANISRLGERLKPWGVNRVAQIAGEFLLRYGEEYVKQVVRFLEDHRPAFVEELATLPGIEVIPGAAHFILCFLKGEMQAAALRERMLEQRIMIRNCGNFRGLDNNYFRVSMQDEAKNARCLQALRLIIQG